MSQCNTITTYIHLYTQLYTHLSFKQCVPWNVSSFNTNDTFLCLCFLVRTCRQCVGRRECRSWVETTPPFVCWFQFHTVLDRRHLICMHHAAASLGLSKPCLQSPSSFRGLLLWIFSLNNPLTWGQELQNLQVTVGQTYGNFTNLCKSVEPVSALSQSWDTQGRKGWSSRPRHFFCHPSCFRIL